MKKINYNKNVLYFFINLPINKNNIKIYFFQRKNLINNNCIRIEFFFTFIIKFNSDEIFIT